MLVGEGPHNDLRAEVLSLGRNRIVFRADHVNYEIPATGRHHLTAGLCAIAVAREVGLDAKRIAEGLARFQSVAGRCQLQQLGAWDVIDDSYNANPRSMQAACELLRDWSGNGKKILVAGDMLELGKQAADCHRRFGRAAVEAGVDCLLVHGPHAGHAIRGALEAGIDAERLAHCTTFETVLAVLDCWAEPGDVILVKGSRGMRMERVVEWLRGAAVYPSYEITGRAPARECA
jgi:UDP-N-acetylmuramoyl-tripeptide--D-alanyl-D-alanine ligase